MKDHYRKKIYISFWLTNPAAVLQFLQKQSISYSTVYLGTFGNPFFQVKMDFAFSAVCEFWDLTLGSC